MRVLHSAARTRHIGGVNEVMKEYFKCWCGTLLCQEGEDNVSFDCKYRITGS